MYNLYITMSARQKLVLLLFRRNSNKNTTAIMDRSSCSGAVDFSDHSYQDLRTEYLKKLHLIHPDKIRNNINKNNEDKIGDESMEKYKKEFRDLQSAWDKYNEVSKNMMKDTNGNSMTANFTQFGVGCSFSDNEEERAHRNEITDQACRGWFSGGLVSSRHNDGTKSMGKSTTTADDTISLLDDTMFVVEEEILNNNNTFNLSRATDNQTKPTEIKSHPFIRNRKTLVQGIKVAVRE